jgi:hypothetical protein
MSMRPGGTPIWKTIHPRAGEVVCGHFGEWRTKRRQRLHHARRILWCGLDPHVEIPPSRAAAHRKDQRMRLSSLAVLIALVPMTSSSAIQARRSSMPLVPSYPDSRRIDTSNEFANVGAVIAMAGKTTPGFQKGISVSAPAR